MTATILIIDDEANVRKTLKLVLEKAGYTVRLAVDGRKGVAAFKEGPADLVITDIIMPEQEGVETIIQIRALNKKMPIIAMSGGGRVGNMNFLEIAGKMGANAVLPKPIKSADLLAAVSAALAAV